MLGESMGRARGNEPRASARRRMTDQERAEKTRMLDDPDQWPEGGRPRAIRWWVDNIAIALIAMAVNLTLIGLVIAYDGIGRRIVLGILITYTILVHMIAFPRRL